MAKYTPSAKLKRSQEEYRIDALKNPRAWTEAELRAEYSRLRSIAQKRLARLESSKDFSESKTVQINKGKFVPLKEVTSREQLAALTHEVSKFITAKSSTVTGQKEIRRKTLESLRAAGIDIREEDYAEFGKFMEYMRAKYGEEFDSDQAAELYKLGSHRGISAADLIANYETFKDYKEELKTAVKPSANPKAKSASAVFKRMGIKDTPNKAVDLSGWYAKHSEAAKTSGWTKKGKKR